MEKVVLMFAGGFHGKSRKGNEFNMTTFYQVFPDKENEKKLKSKQLSFFTEEELKWDQYNFGDLVECEVEQPEFLGESPQLVSMGKIVMSSPYVNVK